MVVAPQALAAFVSDLFEAAGLAAGDAGEIARVLVWADARGTASHGVSRVPRYLEFIHSGALDPRATPQVRQAFGACVAIDGRRAAGPVAMAQAVERAIEIARVQGVCFAAVANTTHTGAIGCYAQRIAAAGCVAIVGAAGVPNMAYYQARAAGLSTSPLAIAVPAVPHPLLLDMATSVAALGRLNQATEDGKIPVGWALDREGRPTTDPAAAALALPLGGAKGSGLALMFECLSGVLAGAPVLSAMLPPRSDRRHRQSAFVIAVSVEAFGPRADFEAAVAELGAAIRALPRQDGVTELLLPGERGDRCAARSAETGIQLSAAAWGGLVEAAARFGVAVPALAEAP